MNYLSQVLFFIFHLISFLSRCGCVYVLTLPSVMYALNDFNTHTHTCAPVNVRQRECVFLRARSATARTTTADVEFPGKRTDTGCSDTSYELKDKKDNTQKNSPFGPYFSKLTLICSRVSPVFSFTPKLSKTSVADLVCAFSILDSWA